MSNRIAVTGIGLVTASGDTAAESWESICAGSTGIRRNTLFDTSELLSGWAGMVPTPQDPAVDRCYALADTAVREAVQHSGLHLDDRTAERVGLVVGSSLGAMPTLEGVHRVAIEDGFLDADKAASAQLHCVVDHLAERLGLRGPRILTSNACAAGAIAVGYAAELLWHGDADYVVCGGVDALTTLSTHGFTCLGALDPEPCSPMSASTGLTLGEGAGFMILEREDTARERGATVLAEIAGYGTSCDGYHQTAPDPGGEGALGSMSAALDVAGVESCDIDYINLHGTGTPANDVAEPKAIRLLFAGDEIPPASSTKSELGHTLGAAGAIETICSVLALVHQQLPPTINTRGKESRSGLDIVPWQSKRAELKVVLNNSFAFGGNNASVVVSEAGFRPERDGVRYDTEVVVTGAAAIAGSASSTADVLAALAAQEPSFAAETLPDGTEVPMGRADLRQLARRLNPAKVRRMDPMGVLASSVVADLQSRHGKPTRQQAADTGIVFATGYGPVTAVSTFDDGIIRDGIRGANALVFPNTVVNAAAGHLAMLNHYRGYTATLACGGTSAIYALQLAARVIARGGAERIVVVVADEFPEIAVQVCSRLPGFRTGTPGARDRGAVLAEGAFALLLEARPRAEERGAPVLGVIRGFGAAGEPAGISKIGRDGVAWARSLQLALDEAGVGPDQVSEVVSAASGHPIVDAAERRALRQVRLGGTERTTPKHVLGESHGSAAGVGLVGALLAPGRAAGDLLLVSSFAHGGSYASMVVEAA